MERHEPQSGVKQPFSPIAPFTLPGVKMITAGVLAAFAVGALATAVVWLAKPDLVRSAAMGAVPAAVGVVLGILVIRPGVSREPAKWAMALFAAQGIGVFGVLISAVLLYSAARPDPLVFAMVASGAFTAAAVTLASVFSAHLKSLPRQ